MKKLLSLAMSLGICVSGMTGLTSNAVIHSVGGWYVILNGDIPNYLQPCDEWNEYLDLTPESNGYVYKNINITPHVRYCRVNVPNNDGDIQIWFDTMWGKFTDYKCVSMEEAEAVEAYINEKYPEFSTRIQEFNSQYEDSVYVYISGDVFNALSYEEQFEIAKDIKANTGVKASPTYLASPANEGYSIGDTDMDGEITISDAAQIMSFVTNKEQYPLSEMSQAVGDIYNTGDGINNMDALQIQRILANVE